MSNEQLTDNDLELIELAESTTYCSSIRKYIDEADTEYCKKILTDIMNSNEIAWED
ncbi:MAG: hypothetical protein NC044_05470 [Prevotella sp.]|nr:hypothetical protein [Lachnospiraceae bacterium]MCM1379561.1 hypothetical protein [Bacteroides sp.]MCM1445837.1 hypothetical protein [Prevotella sp.]